MQKPKKTPAHQQVWLFLLSHQKGCCELVSASCSTNWESCEAAGGSKAPQRETWTQFDSQLPELLFPSKAHLYNVNNAELLSWGSPINNSTLKQKCWKYRGGGLSSMIFSGHSPHQQRNRNTWCKKNMGPVHPADSKHYAGGWTRRAAHLHYQTAWGQWKPAMFWHHVASCGIHGRPLGI